MADNSENSAPIIIKKIKKGGHGGHHGGAWKVAYADFVTAMMAFFLLMWLLNAASQEQKKGLSVFFGPVGNLSGAGGSGGIMGGTSMEKEGQFRDNKSTSVVNADEIKSDTTSGILDSEESSATPDTPPVPVDKTATVDKTTEQAKKLSKEVAEKQLAEAEHEMFKEVEKLLKETIAKDESLKDLMDNLIIDETPEGLRIQIVDRQPFSMFTLGSAEINPRAKELLQRVTGVIEKLPNAISISGYTDSRPYSHISLYSNWELSTERANATRRVLMEFKMPEERIRYIVGRADREHLIQNDPMADENRRISITLLRNHPVTNII